MRDGVMTQGQTNDAAEDLTTDTDAKLPSVSDRRSALR
jgi:hypothetical protein